MKTIDTDDGMSHYIDVIPALSREHAIELAEQCNRKEAEALANDDHDHPDKPYRYEPFYGSEHDAYAVGIVETTGDAS